MGKTIGGGILKVSSNHNEEWIELTNKSEIEDAIYLENRKKVSQTNSTLMILELLVSKLGFLEDSKACEKILEGIFNILSEVD